MIERPRLAAAPALIVTPPAVVTLAVTRDVSDTTDPTISILVPTNGPVHQTSGAQVNLSGDANDNSGSVTVTMDDSGFTGRIITPYVFTMGGMKIETITQDTNPFGGSAEKPTSVGVYKSITIPITGFFDDTATVGPHTVFKTITSTVAAASRTLVVVTGGGTYTVECIVTGYEVMPKNGALTEYAATLQTVAVAVWS